MCSNLTRLSKAAADPASKAEEPPAATAAVPAAMAGATMASRPLPASIHRTQAASIESPAPTVLAASMQKTVAMGKKVFFLNPLPVLSEVAEELAKSEYEVYLVSDHRRLRKVLASDGESILFLNVDQTPEPGRWESYVKEVLCDGSCQEVGVGILTTRELDRELREKYTVGLQVPCGIVALKRGTAKAVELLKLTLDANDARGKRRHVRAFLPPGSGQCNVETDQGPVYAEITEISSVGMAVTFDGTTSFPTGTLLRKLAIQVKGFRLIADGFVAHERADSGGSITSVIMFVPSSLDEQKSERLRLLVYRLNQVAMDQLLV